ncbi:GTP-binding protein [Micrococcaceae bacterium Sec5.7]
MHLSLVSSLDTQCRQTATARLGQTHTSSVVVHHDLLEGSIVLRRIFSAGVLTERVETALEHGCLSCTVRLDIVPTVERLMSAGYHHAVLGLPPGVSVEMAVAALAEGLDRPVTVDNAVLAVDPAELEDQIRDRHTLYASGFTSMPGDDRTSGEFLIGELSHVDTVMVQPGLSSELAGASREESAHWSRGLELMSQLAPHAVVAGAADEFKPGCYDGREAVSRSRRGAVRIPVQERTGRFRTVLHRVERPLHPARFRLALPRLAAGSHWMRGRLWIASAADLRIALQGIGPRVWFESTGQWLDCREAWSAGSGGNNPGTAAGAGAADADADADAALGWHPDFGDRGTVVAITGRDRDIDAAEIKALLDGCQLSDEEMRLDFSTLEDPLELGLSL